MMRCKQTERVLVVTEWQSDVLCPQCPHYRDGACACPQRQDAGSACPFDGVPLGEFSLNPTPGRGLELLAASV